jgi:hypothetical protein
MTATTVETTVTAAAAEALTAQDLAVLTFAKRTFRYPGDREEAIRKQFGHSATTYYQRLNWLIDRPEAYEAEPVLVTRLARLRDTRRTHRSARNLAERAPR